MRKYRILEPFVISLLFVMWTHPAFAQVDTAWVRRYNGPGNDTDRIFALAVDPWGNVYVAGDSWTDEAKYDYVTIKYDPSGSELWVKRYNGPASYWDHAWAMAVDSFGNIYVTGQSSGIGTGYDYATIKYDSLGNELWVRRYNGPRDGDDWAAAIVVDAYGSIYVIGTIVTSRGDCDYATIRYYANGDTAWIRTYDGPGNADDMAKALTLDDRGGVYVTGESYGWGTCEDYAIVKYDSSGNELWVRRHNGPGYGRDAGWAIATDDSGNIYVTGDSWGDGTGMDYLTIKYDSSGNELWVSRYNGVEDYRDFAYAIAIDDSGNVYVTGGSQSGPGFFLYEYATVKYDCSGHQVWARRYDGPGTRLDVAHTLALDGSGNVYVSGPSWDDETYYDYATIKYSPSGDQLWVKRFDGPANDYDVAHAMVLDGNGNFYVAGWSVGVETHYDFTTIKYVQAEVFVEEKDQEDIVSSFVLSQNYPNPFNPQTVIEYTLNSPSDVTLRIYNIKGQLVKTLIDGRGEKGFHQTIWDGKNEKGEKTSSGIYFYELKASDYVLTKKMVKLR